MRRAPQFSDTASLQITFLSAERSHSILCALLTVPTQSSNRVYGILPKVWIGFIISLKRHTSHVLYFEKWLNNYMLPINLRRGFKKHYNANVSTVVLKLISIFSFVLKNIFSKFKLVLWPTLCCEYCNSNGQRGQICSH